MRNMFHIFLKSIFALLAKFNFTFAKLNNIYVILIFIRAKFNLICARLKFICEKCNFMFSKLKLTFTKFNFIRARTIYKWHSKCHETVPYFN